MDMAWCIPAAAGYVVLGLAGSVASPSMAARGAGSMGLLATSREGPLPLRFDIQVYLDEIKKSEALLAPITREAALRRAQLAQLGRGS